MNIETRIALCRLIEKINRQQEYCDKIGIRNASILNICPAKNAKASLE